MIVFPNSKINLGLRIINKREDGYHNLETVFYPIPLKDALEIIEADNENSVQFTSSGLAVNGNETDNLCVKAYHLLKKDFSNLPSVKIHLHKNIPMGAGLGGGSGDAAFTLQLLNNQFKLNLSVPQLIEYALQLGSDCPFFIINKPCIGTGRGEILAEISLDLSMYNLIIVNPNIHINTGEAFNSLHLQKQNIPISSLKEIIRQPIESWRHSLKNDFELPVFDKHPAIKKIKDTLYQKGAAYAAMSGSGSTVYGLFLKNEQPSINFSTSFFARQLSL